MAKSRFEYVRNYEQDLSILPNTYIVIRVDGRGFHKISKEYDFAKPNDRRALDLMNVTAKSIVEQFPETLCAYGQSDEYSFVLKRDCALFERRQAKLVSTFAATFTAQYIFRWPQFFTEPLKGWLLPTFDARTVIYPTIGEIRDYLSWRQADCHINNLYNTSYWTLVLRGGMSEHEAEQTLKGTNSSDKNELLFSQFSINYNCEDEMYRKGTIITAVRERGKRRIKEAHVDVIGDEFWKTCGFP
ncbi:tRNAHis guanylyltransferase-domain-containing protein [Lipomyces arxii]|uniref:tRNAHis guanylyltransferase-domain-containing protein n=1 Tax=Lipomyces arxii TaxID=56418 RepID=UPI0034CE4BB8